MKTFQDYLEENCWVGYKQVGMKKKGNKMVPNCVPVDEVAQDKDIKDKEGTQPAKYYAGDMAKSTKDKRAAHFAKKKSGPAPGDASAKTKPSKHTKKYDQMFGEDSVKKVTSGEFAGRSTEPVRPDLFVHKPRPVDGAPHRRPGRCDVSRQARGTGLAPRSLWITATPLHPSALFGDPACGRCQTGPRRRPSTCARCSGGRTAFWWAIPFMPPG